MSREVHKFSNTEIFKSELVNRVFGEGTVSGMQSLYVDAQDSPWFTELQLVVPMNQHGVDGPSLYVGIDPALDESGVETYDVLDEIKANKYPGISYGYFADGVTEKGQAIACTPSHIPNYKL